MLILERDNRGTHTIPVEAKLFAERKIYLTGGIDAGMATEAAQMISWLDRQDSAAPISIYINSQGGEVYAGLMIYDLIKAARTPIDLYCTGIAASMAAVILAGGRDQRDDAAAERKSACRPVRCRGCGHDCQQLRDVRVFLRRPGCRHMQESVRADKYDCRSDCECTCRGSAGHAAGKAAGRAAPV